MRKGFIERKTRETDIALGIDLDGCGSFRGNCPIHFLGHMLEAFCCHGLFDIDLRAAGDVDVDPHHVVEDCGRVLGQAFSQALGDRSGIARAASFLMPMDEALAEVAVDLSRRPFFVFRGRLSGVALGNFAPALTVDFLVALSQGLEATIHASLRRGLSDHHKLEALFKALARALAAASRVEPRRAGMIPSSKGAL